VNTRRAAGAAPSYRAAAVTARKGELVPAGDGALAGEPVTDALVLDDRRQRGTEWGTAVHAVLDRSAVLTDAAQLRRFARSVLVGIGRPANESGEPAELEELLATVAAVQASALWARALAAPQRLLEVPFAVRLSGAEYAALAGLEETQTSPVEIVDGRIDLVFGDARGWSIVDYKTDAAGARVAPEVLERYRAQVRLYAAVWERITGEPVRERVLLFTSGDRPEAVTV
jgi:ATP-dependent exoDNAse (exonuclease V) beta subunit